MEWMHLTDSDAGTYADNISITPTATGAATLTGSNGFDQENYNISYATGDLTINRRSDYVDGEWTKRRSTEMS